MYRSVSIEIETRSQFTVHNMRRYDARFLPILILITRVYNQKQRSHAFKAIANRNVFEATIQVPPGFFVRLNFVENVSKK